MLNRYVAQGVALDLLDGKTVLYIAAHRTSIRQAVDVVGKLLVAAGASSTIRVTATLASCST